MFVFRPARAIRSTGMNTLAIEQGRAREKYERMRKREREKERKRGEKEGDEEKRD